ncbi:MAG: DM13 domain-containing protein [Sphingobacteriales bacterium]|nr:DM13 domain-containing protein [Sphingobacteriales bacterium]
MKKQFILLIMIAVVACKKETAPVVNPSANKLPVANAGADKEIVLPASSVILNGTGTDEDGTIISYNWAYVSGPAQYNIVSASTAQTEINNLVKGIYQFQLKVTDDKGAMATDLVTLKVTENTTTSPAGAPAGVVIASTRIVEGPFGGDKANGDAMIYNDNGKWNLFLSDFLSAGGPDLRVYLATDKSAGVFIDLGKLRSTSGNQTYAITGNPALSTYKYVIIWCKQFGVYFGGGELK